MASFTPEQLSYMQDHISEDRRPQQIVLYSVLIALCVVAVVLRFIARTRIGAHLWWDDYLSVLGMLTACAFAGIMIAQAELGTGLHIIRVPAANVTKITQLTYAIQLLYPITLTVTKISILCLYWRLFPTRAYRIAMWVVGAFATAWCIEIFIASIFQCTPVSYLWTHKGKGHCFPVRGAFAIANAPPNIGVDIALLVMPIRAVWRLHTRTREKLALTGTFLLGSFVVIVSIVRFVYLSTGNLTMGDVTWNTVEFHIWTTVEPTVAVICACLPTMKPLIGRRRSPQSSRLGGSGRYHSNWPASSTDKSTEPDKIGLTTEWELTAHDRAWEVSTLGNSAPSSHMRSEVSRIPNTADADDADLEHGKIHVRRDVDWQESRPAASQSSD